MSATNDSFADFCAAYMKEAHRCLDLISSQDLDDVVVSLWKAYERRSRVWVAGNGGSATTAVHMACCLSQGTMVEGKSPLRAEALVSNISFLTAVANDHGYDHVFEYQLCNCLSPGDIFIAISCSGNSPNVVLAAEYAKQGGAHTIGLLGFGGGKLLEICHQSIYIENYNYGHVESAHLFISHLISQYLKHRIAES